MKTNLFHRATRVLLTLLSLALLCPRSAALTYASLVNNYGGVFPNYNDARQNTIEFNQLLRDTNGMVGNHAARTIRFAAGTYEFNVNVEGGGQLASFENVGNLTLQGATSGETVLSWISGLSDGDTTSNPNYFWSFDLNCRAITITNLAFDSTHTHRYGAGQHVRFLGKHLEVQYCTFRHAPNYAIEIADGNADSAAEYIHIDSNSFIDCFGDPIHVHNGSDVWIVGNYIQNSGDDAIAVVADDFEADGLKASNVHILSNNINGSQWRGIAIVTADDVHIENNFIHGGSRHGIEITPIATEHNTAFDGDVPENQWAHGVSLLNNTIQYAGYPPDHDGLFHQDACGLIQKNVRNVTATGNTIHDIKGHGIYLRWVTGAEYGSLSQIWSFGTGGAGDGIRGEGYMANISTWFYSPGN